MYGWFELAIFTYILAAKGSQAMPVLSTVEAQLSLHKHKIVKEPQNHGNAKKTVELAKIRNYVYWYVLQYSVSHNLSKHHDPVDSQCQLECNYVSSTPVGIDILHV